MKRLLLLVTTAWLALSVAACSAQSNVDKREAALIKAGYPTDLENSCLSTRDLFGKRTSLDSFCAAEIAGYRHRVAFQSVDRGWVKR